MKSSTEEIIVRLKNRFSSELEMLPGQKYSNLCKANMEVIKVLEIQVKRMAKELGATHQLVLFSQEQLNELRKKTFGKSSENRNDLSLEEKSECKCQAHCQ